MKLNMDDAANIWTMIQEAQMALSTREEKRTTAEWIDAVVNRVEALIIASGATTAADREIIMNVWLIMSLQEQAKWKSAAARMARDIGEVANEAAAEGEPMPPDDQKH